MVREGKKDPHASCAWWDDCVNSVKVSIFTDNTTTKDTLHEKAKNYALNYLSTCIEVGFIDRTRLANDIAEEVEDQLKDHVFDTTPLAYTAARVSRDSIPSRPEDQFIKLG